MDGVDIEGPRGLNGYQRKLIHDTLRTEFPALRAYLQDDGASMRIVRKDDRKDAEVLLCSPAYYITHIH